MIIVHTGKLPHLADEHRNGVTDDTKAHRGVDSITLIVAVTLGIGAANNKSISTEKDLIKSIVIAILDDVASKNAIRLLLDELAVKAVVDGIAIGAKVGIVITIVIIESGGAKVESFAIAELTNV